MITAYESFMRLSAPALKFMLRRRMKKGREDPARLSERLGHAGVERPEGALIWFHAASVGEAQSALILIEALRREYPEKPVLVTTGTVTSADLLGKRLPEKVLHQYYPVDHPVWVDRFLSFWQPSLAVWMESEIWPSMLTALDDRGIPVVLINARLSDKSYKRWRRFGKTAETLFRTFSVCFSQSEHDGKNLRALGAQNIKIMDNIKYAAAPLPFDKTALDALKNSIGDRPLWLYASTHEGEEALACRVHNALLRDFPELLTIIVPRHPERRDRIAALSSEYDVRMCFRGTGKLPAPADQIYVADTMGDLGLFYRLSPIACIGRSLSLDGGGGHNPIEAAQLDCAILHGPHVQNLPAIYKDLDDAGAALKVKDETDLKNRIARLLADDDGRQALQEKARSFVSGKSRVRDQIIAELCKLIESAAGESREEAA